MHNVEIWLALNGAVMLFVSLLSGGFFARAINNKNREVAWRVVHSGGSMGGVMLIAFASVVRLTPTGAWLLSIFAWLAILGGWALVAGMLAAALTGQRGLRVGDSRAGNLIYAAYIAGSVLSLAAVGLLVIGLAVALA